MKETVKFVVSVPETHADQVRKALGDAGGGIIGNYHHCSLSIKGVGRSIPTDAANPYIGSAGEVAEIIEERIETPCYREDLPKIIAAVRKAHPYEEPVIEVYPLINYEE